MGGGTSRINQERELIQGLSPRGRGNLLERPAKEPLEGPIPAWAGEPSPTRVDSTQSRAYPRVGGGTGCPRLRPAHLAGLSPRGRGNRACAPPCVSNQGLSPRGRGNHLPMASSQPALGPIPAWAGEPCRDLAVAGGPWAYPRVGGGTALERTISSRSSPIRAYPRVGGGTRCQQIHTCSTVGLSPRGRGNRWKWLFATAIFGPIPAWAGEPPEDDLQGAVARAYPRVGGGTVGAYDALASCKGLSPRGRGNPGVGERDGLMCGPIPAWAGEPSEAEAWLTATRAYPRVGGGTSRGAALDVPDWGLSPRGRGNLGF